MELMTDDTPQNDEQAPTATEMIDGLMTNAYMALGTLFEVTQTLHRMAQDRPDIVPSLANARTFTEAGFLFLQNAATGLVAKIKQAEEEEQNNG